MSYKLICTYVCKKQHMAASSSFIQTTTNSVVTSALWQMPGSRMTWQQCVAVTLSRLFGVTSLMVVAAAHVHTYIHYTVYYSIRCNLTAHTPPACPPLLQSHPYPLLLNKCLADFIKEEEKNRRISCVKYETSLLLHHLCCATEVGSLFLKGNTATGALTESMRLTAFLYVIFFLLLLLFL